MSEALRRKPRGWRSWILRRKPRTSRGRVVPAFRRRAAAHGVRRKRRDFFYRLHSAMRVLPKLPNFATRFRRCDFKKRFFKNLPRFARSRRGKHKPRHGEPPYSDFGAIHSGGKIRRLRPALLLEFVRVRKCRIARSLKRLC